AHGRTARLKGNDLHGGILRFGCKRNPDWGQRRKGAISGACRRLKVAPKDVVRGPSWSRSHPARAPGPTRKRAFVACLLTSFDRCSFCKAATTAPRQT